MRSKPFKTMHELKFKNCRSETHKNILTDFVYEIRRELYLSKYSDCSEIIDLCFEHGGMMGCFQEKKLIATLGYFRGCPEMNFENKHVGFIYFAGIHDKHRSTPLFLKSLIFALKHFGTINIDHIKLHAVIEDLYTNNLYKKFAEPLGTGKSLKGKEVIVYGNSIKNILKKYEKLSKRFSYFK